MSFTPQIKLDAALTLPSRVVRRIVPAVNYSVLFRQFPLDQLDALAPVVAQTFGITNFDARAKIRKGWGFLEREATDEDARRIVEAIGDLAGGAVAIDNAQLRTPAEPKVITAFESGENAVTFRLQSPQEPTRAVEWSEVSVVAAGGFTEETILRESGGNEKKLGQMMMGLGVFMVTGLPMGMFGGGKKKEVKPVKSSRVITFARIVTRAGQQFAFSPEHFDFSGLGEKKQMNAAGNFRALLGEFARASSAKINLGARLLLDNRSITFANYAGLHDFETELLWLMNAPNAASK
jgi:hypothetical protein